MKVDRILIFDDFNLNTIIEIINKRMKNNG